MGLGKKQKSEVRWQRSEVGILWWMFGEFWIVLAVFF
jgi:hypothetical protein